MAGIHQGLIEEYLTIPIVTRVYTTSCVLTTFFVQLGILSPFQLYFNLNQIRNKLQVWRLFTAFLYFGPFGFNFLFNLIFTYRYCRMLEEGSFRNKTADFILMLLFGATCTVIVAAFVRLLFLGQAFTIMLVYIWGRRNPTLQLNFFGMTFFAPYLPWVLLIFSLLLGNSALVDTIGITVGHLYYYLADVFPYQRGGFHILKAPLFLVRLFESFDQELPPLVDIPPEDEPGGFAWGGEQN